MTMTVDLLLFSLLLLLLPPFATPSSIRRPGSSSAPRRQRSAPSSSLPHTRPDRFVSASPLAVAAVCRDGVALVAVHPASALEPLLLPKEASDDQDDKGSPGGDGGGTDPPATLALRDLPPGHRGPFRIDPVDGSGTALLSAGWRTDCSTLAASCRSLAAEEAADYGAVAGEGGAGSSSTLLVGRGADYGRGIADGAALWMAQCALSDDVRDLSCVGLLAACGSHGGDGGYLWLVDATGAHRARAHAVGNGARVVNDRLIRIDFSGLIKEEGAKKILDVIAEVGLAGKDAGWDLPRQSRVEVAAIDSTRGTLQRLRQPFMIE